MAESRLDRMVTELREYAEELEEELRRVRRALIALDADEPEEESSASTLDILFEVFRDYPGKILTAQEATQFMRKAGWITDSKDPVNAVRAAIGRLVERGDVERVEGKRGVFRLKHATHPQAEGNPTPPDPRQGDDPWGSAPPTLVATASDDDEPPF